MLLHRIRRRLRAARALVAAAAACVALTGASVPCLCVCLGEAAAATSCHDEDAAPCHDDHCPPSPCLQDQAQAIATSADSAAPPTDPGASVAVAAPAHAALPVSEPAPRRPLAPDRSPPAAAGAVILRI